MKENKTVIKMIIWDIVFVCFAIFTNIDLFGLITIGGAMVMLNVLMIVNTRLHGGEEVDLREHKIVGFFYALAIVLAVIGVGRIVFM